ncbi:hypothetical protein D3C71_2222760 [compost metagenome]
MTQQNGALVGESATSAENLREQAQRLAELVAVFHVNDGANMVSASPRATPRNRSTTSLQPTVRHLTH